MSINIFINISKQSQIMNEYENINVGTNKFIDNTEKFKNNKDNVDCRISRDALISQYLG